MEDCDLVSIDDQLVTLNLDLTVVAAVGRVILEHVDLQKRKDNMTTHDKGAQQDNIISEIVFSKISSTYHVLQVDEWVIDGHNLHLLGVESSTGHQTTDAAESVK